MQCDFCKCNSLTKIYDVPTSRIGACVHSCDNCGLIQSLYANKENKHTNKSISSGADWGNVRHGKKIRLDASISFIETKCELSKVKRVLDIGSNRGHFVNYILKVNSNCNIVAIEPDNRILDGYDKNHRLTVLNSRFENYNEVDKFDFIYCCHTLEHADSAHEMLVHAISLLEEDGYMYIDVPSLSVVSDKTNVQEFFIDKHTFHFSISILHKHLTHLGLTIVDCKDDMHNIVFLCQKKNKSIANFCMIEKYKTILDSNYKKLTYVSSLIEDICANKRVAIIGASKIYDSLVKYGNFNSKNVKYLIDDYLSGYIDEVHGKPIFKQEDVQFKEIDVVILLTKSATNDLMTSLKNKGITKIYTFNDFIIK
jgi:SAM-dependent methyltransferase